MLSFFTSSLNVGQMDMTDEEIIENIQTAIERLISVVPGGEKNISSFKLHVHMNNLPEIPIYISSGMLFTAIQRSHRHINTVAIK